MPDLQAASRQLGKPIGSYRKISLKADGVLAINGHLMAIIGDVRINWGSPAKYQNLDVLQPQNL